MRFSVSVSLYLVGVMMLTMSSFSYSGGRVPHPETRKTASGAEFIRASEEDLKAAGVRDLEKFGEAWIDPSGMIWGDIAKNEDGSPLFRELGFAETYGKSLGAELPSGWQEDQNGKFKIPNRDSDFVRLRKDMGAQYAVGSNSPGGYTPQILPNLNRWHWSPSVYRDDSTFGYFFYGHGGDLFMNYRYYPMYHSLLPTNLGNPYYFYGRQGFMYNHFPLGVVYVSVRCVVARR